MSYRLGKLPAKKDDRNIQFKQILRELPPLPTSFNLDETLPLKPVPEQVFGNDRYGDCVIAGRANHTLRFECIETEGTFPLITEADCLNQYWYEQGWRPCRIGVFNFARPKPDNGLVILDSIKVWRREGWDAAGKHYDIYAFAEVPVHDHDILKAAIMLLVGVKAGILFPSTAMNQFREGKRWEYVDGASIEGGHDIYLVGWDEIGPTCITWGQLQRMTWEFWEHYADEAYAVVDNKDSWLPDSPIDVAKLAELLQQVTGKSPSQTPG